MKFGEKVDYEPIIVNLTGILADGGRIQKPRLGARGEVWLTVPLRSEKSSGEGPVPSRGLGLARPHKMIFSIIIFSLQMACFCGEF